MWDMIGEIIIENHKSVTEKICWSLDKQYTLYDPVQHRHNLSHHMSQFARERERAQGDKISLSRQALIPSLSATGAVLEIVESRCVPSSTLLLLPLFRWGYFYHQTGSPLNTQLNRLKLVYTT